MLHTLLCVSTYCCCTRCTHTHTLTNTHKHTQSHLHTHTHTHTPTHTDTCAHTNTHTHTHAHARTRSRTGAESRSLSSTLKSISIFKICFWNTEIDFWNIHQFVTIFATLVTQFNMFQRRHWLAPQTHVSPACIAGRPVGLPEIRPVTVVTVPETQAEWRPALGPWSTKQATDQGRSAWKANDKTDHGATGANPPNEAPEDAAGLAIQPPRFGTQISPCWLETSKRRNNRRDRPPTSVIAFASPLPTSADANWR